MKKYIFLPIFLLFSIFLFQKKDFEIDVYTTDEFKEFVEFFSSRTSIRSIEEDTLNGYRKRRYGWENGRHPFEIVSIDRYCMEHNISPGDIRYILKKMKEFKIEQIRRRGDEITFLLWRQFGALGNFCAIVISTDEPFRYYHGDGTASKLSENIWLVDTRKFKKESLKESPTAD
jgi:hypothetical protein